MSVISPSGICRRLPVFQAYNTYCLLTRPISLPGIYPNLLYAGPVYVSCSPKFRRDLLEVLGRLDIDDLGHLACVAHQLLGAGVQHTLRAVTRRRHVEEHDVGDGKTTGGLFTGVSFLFRFPLIFLHFLFKNPNSVLELPGA